MKFINNLGLVNLICLPVTVLLFFIGPVASIFYNSFTFFDMTFRMDYSSSNWVGMVILIAPIVAFILAGLGRYLISSICDYVTIIILLMNYFGMTKSDWGNISGMLGWGFWGIFFLMIVAAVYTTYKAFLARNNGAVTGIIQFNSKSQNSDLTKKLSALKKPSKTTTKPSSSQTPRVKPRALPSQQASAEIAPSEQTQTTSKTKICPECQSEIDIDARFCTECGHNFSEE